MRCNTRLLAWALGEKHCSLKAGGELAGSPAAGPERACLMCGCSSYTRPVKARIVCWAAAGPLVPAFIEGVM